MKNSDGTPQYNESHYAVVDLGSNSFHLLISELKHNQATETPQQAIADPLKLLQNHFVVVNKVKKKVRLAAGLNNQNVLNDKVMQDGLRCLGEFSQHLKTIPVENIIIVATATLRIAQNRDEFMLKANAILPKNIQLLSGEQEAETIYFGATNPSPFVDLSEQTLVKTGEKNIGNQLVIDIGGASTELIVGCGTNIKTLFSLSIGCVSFKQKYFIDGKLTEQNFVQAIDEATQVVLPLVGSFTKLGWQSVLGNSGIMQALAEILQGKGKNGVIDHHFLNEVKQQMIAVGNTEQVCFTGLRADRIPVLASGLAILMALFNCLEIQQLRLSSGALREGLLLKLLPSN